MKAELQKILFDKYPKIFRQKDLSMKETAMCWGIDAGPGWFDLIDNLCSDIQTYIDINELSQVETVQVKEKYGRLCFYIDGGDTVIHDMISLAEKNSETTCENCGSSDASNEETNGWYKTRCIKCKEIR